MIKKILIFLLFTFLLLVIAAGVTLTWGYYYFSRDLPRFDGINNYQLDSVSKIYSSDRELLAEIFHERRYPVKISNIPQHVRNAFLAAEDADFYKHPGIDPISILRAFIKNVREGSVKQGGSTITQQVVKNLLLTREKKLERKIKEAILAFKIESTLSKDEILELYLNQIFFGNTAYGIEAAALLYFHKGVGDLDLAEAAILAGLPKAPSRYSPIANLKEAKRRQKYVINQMYRSDFITKKEAEAAVKQKLKIYKAKRNTTYHAPYYISEVVRRLRKKLPDLDLTRDGLEIYTALDFQAQTYAEKALRKGLLEVDKRRGWRGRIDHFEEDARKLFIKKYRSNITRRLATNKVYPALITKKLGSTVFVDLGYYTGKLSLKNASWAKRYLDKKDKIRWIKVESALKIGDVIEVALSKDLKEIPAYVSLSDSKAPYQVTNLELSQTPQVNGALVLVDPHSGKVLTTIGGYDFYQSQFNRVTQSKRQPGSAFKPIVYLTAVDGFGYTPSTIVFDEPRTFKVGDDYWTPGNFDSKFMGPITLRVALEKSRNLVSADIISKIGVDPVIRYARRMGIKSPMGRNLSLSLGSSEVSLLEMTRAYGVFAAQGILFDSVFVTEIYDRDANKLYDYKTELVKNSSQVIDEKSAFIMANLMKGVVESGTGWRIRELKRPAAGKTGTSNDQMDAWFVGYTPEWACGAWVGFDVKKEIGKKETGGRAASPIWLYFMKELLDQRDTDKNQALISAAKKEAEELGIEYEEPELPSAPDFVVPEGVENYWVNKKSGLLSEKGEPGAILEYYLPETGPEKGDEEGSLSYWDLEE